MAAKPFREALKDLAQSQNKSVSRVMHDAADHDVKGLAPDTLRKAVSGERPIRAFQIEAIARAAGVEPERVPHYRMARLREDLDERITSPETALQTLEEIEARQPDLVFMDETGTPRAWVEIKRGIGDPGTSTATPHVAQVAAEMLAELLELVERGDLIPQAAATTVRPTPTEAAALLLRLQQEAAQRTREQRTTSAESPPDEDSRETGG